MREAGVSQFNASSWYSFFAPALTPREIVSKLNAESVKILRGREMRDLLLPQSAEAIGNNPEEFSVHIKSELTKWAQVVKSIGAKPH